MKSRYSLPTAVLLAFAAFPALALQLGQIQVKSALNEPLVAEIPLKPDNTAELQGLTASLASNMDFDRVGLPRAAVDTLLRFQVITDSSGNRAILITSTQPITSPYLDFLVQVNTKQGKQVREFVVLLDPMIAAPAPVVQSAPVSSAPAAPAPEPAAPPPEPAPPPPQASTKPEAAPPAKPEAAPPPAKPEATPPPAKPEPEQAQPPKPPTPAPRAVTRRSAEYGPVPRGDTLYKIAQQVQPDTSVSINQTMLALKVANPDAFFKDNINDLKEGAILRIPTRDEIDRLGIAKANAEVHRQYEEWRAVKAHKATVVAGSAAEAAAAPTSGNAGSPAAESDRLTLVPPAGSGVSTNSRPGVAGGTGNATVAGLKQQLETGKENLTSLEQSNNDLQSQVRSLKDIATKSGKLLSLKDATVAELQRKLASVQAQAGKSGSSATAASVPSGMAAHATSAASLANPAAAPTSKTPPRPEVTASSEPEPSSQASAWYERPIAWVIGGLIVLALILFGLLRRRKPAAQPLREEAPSLADQFGESPLPAGDGDERGYEDSLRAQIEQDPHNLDLHLELCRLYFAHDDAPRFETAAEAMRVVVADPLCTEWREVVAMGEDLAPGNPLFQTVQEYTAPDDAGAVVEPYFEEGDDLAPHAAHADATKPEDAAAAESERAAADTLRSYYQPDTTAAAPAVRESEAQSASSDSAYDEDAVDTKLDLARAYLDMGDPIGARAMLEEVLQEGTRIQKDEAQRLLEEMS